MQMLQVSVRRGTDEGCYVDYEAPRQTSQTVLDVVTHIAERVAEALGKGFSG